MLRTRLPTVVLTLSCTALLTSVAIAQTVPSAGTTSLPSATAPATAAPSADDQAVFEKNCSACHDLAQVTSQNRDAAAWAETVDRMVNYGAQIAPEDGKRIQAFLAAHYGPKAAAK